MHGTEGRTERRSGSIRRDHGGEGSAREGFPKPDIAISFTGISESPVFDSPRGSGVPERLCSEHSPKAAVEVTTRSTNKKNMDKKWKKYARAGSTTYITVHREKTGGRGNGKVIVGSAEPFLGSMCRTW